MISSFNIMFSLSNALFLYYKINGIILLKIIKYKT